MFRIIFFAFIILFLQIFKSDALAINNIIPNFLIPYSVFLGWTRQDAYPYLIVFLTALAYDLMMPQTLGLNIIALLLVCAVTRAFHRSVLEPKPLVMLVLLLIVCAIYYFIFAIYYLTQSPDVIKLLGDFLFSTGYSGFLSLFTFYILILAYKLKISFH